ncbi:hypothetical protein HanRHA438_Chr09g0394161 [Helianthus annuus]|nr:hypothetical protein HanIR_Chr09g0412431 [Helianthus annuus]KAJ0887727.1 hypothetical protein HanRHA438_Chr09g0394161 [Helianthus annuus]
MGFGTGRVLDRNGSVRIGFGSTQVSARDRFRIATGFGLTRVSARDGFRIATGFRSTRVFARDAFRVGTGFVWFRFLFRFGRFFSVSF